VIASVTGAVHRVDLDQVVVTVGGVGLLLHASPRTLAPLRPGQQVQLATHLVVREDSLTLFGFADDDEKQMFELVQTASGVGPKLAQAMLAVLSPEAIRRAVCGDDVKTLTGVPGIGQKGAQRIILELRDRIGTPGSAALTAVSAPAASGWQIQVHGGLVGLGWTGKEADQAVAAVTPEAEQMPVPDVARLLRLALQTLSRA
jgi:Holliday junction DNA helicase RuvA